MPIDIEQIRPLYGADASHDFDHVLRVLRTAECIGEAEGADAAILRTAVLLHDIGRDEQRRTGEDHAAIGARRAREILVGEPGAFVEAVCHAIACHRFRVESPPETLEAKILYDADKLDSIGAIGVARAFVYGGHVGRRIWAEDDEGEHTALQEFRVKLRHVRDRLHTDAARAIADDRHAFMVAFFERMGDEVRGRA